MEEIGGGRQQFMKILLIRSGCAAVAAAGAVDLVLIVTVQPVLCGWADLVSTHS